MKTKREQIDLIKDSGFPFMVSFSELAAWMMFAFIGGLLAGFLACGVCFEAGWFTVTDSVGQGITNSGPVGD